MIALLTAPLRWMRRLYDWVLHWSHTPHAVMALALLSFAESSFFPIPPDVLLIALCIGAHRRWARFATVTSVSSVVGGAFGYLIGYFAYDAIGQPIMAFVAGLADQSPEQMIEVARYWFNEKEVAGFKVGAWAVAAAGFTPIPYKVFTIAAGFFKMNFAVFLLASAISRPLRFFLVAGLVGLLYKKYGDRIGVFIDKYFNLLATAFFALLVLGVLAIRWLK